MIQKLTNIEYDLEGVNLTKKEIDIKVLIAYGSMYKQQGYWTTDQFADAVDKMGVEL